MIRRVVVTGLGIISPVGNSTGEVWSSLLNSKDGTGPISSFAYPSFPAKTAGEVKNFNPRDYKIKPKSLKLMNKTIQYSDEPIGDIELVADFLPSPEELALKNQNTKVTISLSSESVAYFKDAAKKHHMQYQKMIRQLLDEYVQHQKSTGK